MCTFGQVVAVTGHIHFRRKKKVHIWSSLLDFTQIINAVVVHLEQKQAFAFKTAFGKYFNIIRRYQNKLYAKPKLTMCSVLCAPSSMLATGDTEFVPIRSKQEMKKDCLCCAMRKL